MKPTYTDQSQQKQPGIAKQCRPTHDEMCFLGTCNFTKRC
jgi:hypothetical protein